MKQVIYMQWSLKNTRSWMCLLCLLFFGLLTQAALALSAVGPAASLDELLAPGASLSSVDGSLEFNEFFFNAVFPDASAPDSTEIMVEVITPTGADDAMLRFRITGASQIISSDDAYVMEIGYQAHSRTGDLVFSEVSLDIDGATLGTAGTGIVQLLASLTPQEAMQQASLSTSISAVAAAQLEVIDDGDGEQMLFDSMSIFPGQKSLRLVTMVEVRGGGDSSSGAVLTDFQFGFLRAQAIPEPSSLLLAALTFLTWLMLASRRNGRRPWIQFCWA